MSMKRLKTSYGEEMKKIKIKDIGKLLSQWDKEFIVFAPSRETGVSQMSR